MKRFTLYIAILFIGTFIFTSCESTTEDVVESDSTPPRGGFSFQITKENALKYIAGYDYYADSLNTVLLRSGNVPENAQYLSHGAVVELDEMRRIVRFADSLGVDSCEVSIMSGIIKDTAELIFCLEKKFANDSDPSRLLFFDFTSPCPTSCPAWMPEPKRIEH